MPQLSDLRLCSRRAQGQLQGFCTGLGSTFSRDTWRLDSSSFLWFIFRILQGNPKKELPWSLWVIFPRPLKLQRAHHQLPRARQDCEHVTFHDCIAAKGKRPVWAGSGFRVYGFLKLSGFKDVHIEASGPNLKK